MVKYNLIDSTFSGNDGRWEFRNKPKGNYSISFSKPGYTSDTVFWSTYPDVTHYTIYMCCAPAFTLILDASPQASYFGHDSINYYGYVYGHSSKDTPGDGKIIYGILFCSRKMSNNLRNDASSIAIGSFGQIDSLQHESSIDFKIQYSNYNSDLKTFNHGDTIYVQAFPLLETETIKYRTITSPLGEGSNILMTVLP